MPKRMTVVFEDEALYRALKVESARRGCYARDIVTAAVREWLETQEDEELRIGLEDARGEWERQGGMDASSFFRTLGEAQ